MRVGFDVDGRPPAPNGKRLLADVRPVSANFISTMGMRLLRGRTFTPAEEGFGPPPVVVVTQAFARKYFPGENPIGQRVTFGVSHDTHATMRCVPSMWSAAPQFMHANITGLVDAGSASRWSAVWVSPTATTISG